MNYNPTQLNWFLSHYYKLNELVIKEFLGKRHIKTRKDLMDVVESCHEIIDNEITANNNTNSVNTNNINIEWNHLKTSITIKSVTREYDNIRRIQFGYEEHCNTVGPVNLVDFLELYWLLSPLLAKVCLYTDALCDTKCVR